MVFTPLARSASILFRTTQPVDEDRIAAWYDAGVRAIAIGPLVKRGSREDCTYEEFRDVYVYFYTTQSEYAARDVLWCGRHNIKLLKPPQTTEVLKKAGDEGWELCGNLPRRLLAYFRGKSPTAPTLRRREKMRLLNNTTLSEDEKRAMTLTDARKYVFEKASAEVFDDLNLEINV